MNPDVEFLKKVSKISVNKYCIKYNINMSNLLKGYIKDKELIKKIRKEIEEELNKIKDGE